MINTPKGNCGSRNPKGSCGQVMTSRRRDMWSSLNWKNLVKIGSPANRHWCSQQEIGLSTGETVRMIPMVDTTEDILSGLIAGLVKREGKLGKDHFLQSVVLYFVR